MFFTSPVYAGKPLLYDPDIDNGDVYWLLISWGNGTRVHFFRNGTAYLSVYNFYGTGWTGAKLQQGSMPHSWSQAHPLVFNPTVTPQTDIKIKIRFRVSNVSFNHELNETWVNVGISLWMQRPGTNWNGSDSQLEIGLKLFWIKNGEIMSGLVHFIDADYNDWHSQYDVLNEKLEDVGKWVEAEFNTKNFIANTLRYWNVKQAVLRDFDVYIEVKGASGTLEIDYVYAECSGFTDDLYEPFKNLPYAFITLLMFVFAF
ncbi:MAG: hypothetical protein RMJ03_07150, partial [Nitrososphaerota archaeon]|nr:hypothetical protein [Nitrososphaerota archaeon]